MFRIRSMMWRVAWALAGLRCVLLGPVYWVYVRMRWFFRLRALRRPRRALINAAMEPQDDTLRSVLTSAEGTAHQRYVEAAAWQCASIDELRDLQWTYRQGIETLVAERQARLAQQRATALLLENLTLEQRTQYRNFEYFEVIGGESGRRYRIWRRTHQNIEELDRWGDRRCIWCVGPTGVAMEDILLAQKTALELFEFEALRIANPYSAFAARIA